MNIDNIIEKLITAKIIITNDDGSSYGIYDSLSDSHFLTKEEGIIWLQLLHQADANPCNAEKECTRAHRFHFQPIQ